jgi:DNA polymerase-1
MFWQDAEREKGRNSRVRAMPPIPETGWRPRPYPNLSAARVLAIDVETYDPEIEDHGPGFARGKGHICGFSVGTEDGFKQYFPIRHEVEPEMNMDPGHSLNWLRDTLSKSAQPKVGANLIYDIGWLHQEGIPVAGELVDVQFAAALIRPNEKVALEELGHRYLGEGKDSGILKQWILDFYAPPKDSWRRDIYRSPPRLVGPYGEGDVDLPIRLAPILYSRLKEEGLFDLFQMECQQINLLVAMRFAGVTVDLNKAEEVRAALLERGEAEHKKLDHIAGMKLNPNSSDEVAKAFDKAGLKYPRTPPSKRKPQGAPSFTKDFLKTVEHPLAVSVMELRRLEKLRKTFIESYILNGHVDGKLYCSFHPLRNEEGGTGVGRYSSSNPNLQNIPVRDPVCRHGIPAKECSTPGCLPLGKLVRSIFTPDAGHKQWRKYDYSQIQYRYLVEFAVGEGAEEARQRYIQNPDTDYHNMVQLLVEKVTGKKWDRRPIKNLNFGLSFGMGEAKAGASTGLKGTALQEFLKAYNAAAPFAKKTMQHLMELGKRQGYIRTLLGRKAYFDLWEPVEYGTEQPALPYEQALRAYGRIKRAYLHKTLACLLQGCEGDQIKTGLVRCWKDGVFAVTGVPRLIVHDELDFSDPGGVDEAFKHMHHVMQTVIPTRVPILMEEEIGRDWGEVG